MFEDGFCPAQVINDCGDQIDAIFMKEVKRVDSSEPTMSLWKWPSLTDRQRMNKACILQIRPNLDVALGLSTSRCLIYKLINLEIVKKFAH